MTFKPLKLCGCVKATIGHSSMETDKQEEDGKDPTIYRLGDSTIKAGYVLLFGGGDGGSGTGWVEFHNVNSPLGSAV